MDPPDLSLKIENLEMWEKQLQFVQMVKAVSVVNLIHVLSQQRNRVISSPSPYC